MVKRSKLILVVSAVLLATSVGAAPAAALSPSGFESKVRCYNRTLSTNPELELRRFLVLPPDFGEAGASVGWRFIVRRSSDGLDYKETYRSPIQRAQTSDGFTPMGVKVSVPDGWRTHDPEGYPYRVIIKAFFYRADGSIKSTAKSAVDDYRIWIDGSYARRDTTVCYGRTKLSD